MSLGTHYDVLVIGAGAAGLMCAIAAGRRGRRVLVVEHANRVGKKILMSGGGRCNFTNLHTAPEHFISHNPHFAKSALSRYTQWDFIALVEEHGIHYHEKKLGQLFCDHSSKEIVRMLLAECAAAGVEIITRCSVQHLAVDAPHRVVTTCGTWTCESLVIATGGYSIPKMGATGFGYELAARLGLGVQPTRPALVPLTLGPNTPGWSGELSGVALDANVSSGGVSFREHILFTHKGLSGPAILQASSYWEPGRTITVDVDPERTLAAVLDAARRERPQMQLRNLLGRQLARRVARHWCGTRLPDKPLARLSRKDFTAVVDACQQWTLEPTGTEGYATAEVTAGGIDTNELSSRTMACKACSGLYFIGEVVDVTGHLGGHNFQWAWASGHAAGEVV